MRRWLGWCFPVLVMGIVGLTVDFPHEGASPPCVISLPLGLRIDSEYHAVVVPTEDTVEVGAQGALGGSLDDRVFDRRIHGQVAVVSVHGGRFAAQLEERLVSQHRKQLALVPWQLVGDGTCDLGPWERSYRWLPADSAVFLVGPLREPRFWEKQPPVVDLPPATYVYPHPSFDDELQLYVVLDGETHEQVDSFLATLDRSPITPYEFLSLYEALPTYEECETQPEHVEQRLRRWEASHPVLLNRLVVQKMLRFARSRSQEIRTSANDRSRSPDDEQPNQRLHLARAPYVVNALDCSSIALRGRAVPVDGRDRCRAGETHIR